MSNKIKDQQIYKMTLKPHTSKSQFQNVPFCPISGSGSLMYSFLVSFYKAIDILFCLTYHLLDTINKGFDSKK